MPSFPDELVRIAASGSNPRNKESLKQVTFSLLQGQGIDENMERAVLLSAAAYSLQQQAGYQPPKIDAPLPSTAEIDERIPCSHTAQQHLTLMLNGIHRNLLPQWLTLLNQHGQCIPHELMPNFLKLGVRKKELRDILIKVIAPRGVWLAEEMEITPWNWVLPLDRVQQKKSEYSLWVDDFKQAREADPIAALEQLKAEWDDLNVLQKNFVIPAMRPTLGMYDVPFLVDLLKTNLRPLAENLLMKLPESQFAQEAYEALNQVVVMKQMGDNKQWVIDFAWSWVFEGQPEQMKYYQARNLSRVMGYQCHPELLMMITPLSYWYERYNVDATTLISAASRSDNHSSLFYTIWMKQAIETQDIEFIKSLLIFLAHHGFHAIRTCLDQEQLEDIAQHWFEQVPTFTLDHPTIPILTGIGDVWSDKLADCFLDSLGKGLKHIARPTLKKKWRGLLEVYATRLPLNATERFEQVLHTSKRDDLSESESDVINGIMDIMKFRADMVAAIQSATHQTH